MDSNKQGMKGQGMDVSGISMSKIHFWDEFPVLGIWGPKCTTASQPQSLSDFLKRRRNRKEFPQRKANLAIFHRKMHRNRNRIVTAEKSQPISQKESLRTI